MGSRTVGGAVDVQWWDRFNDPELSSLVARLARQNLDLQEAAERIREARAQRRITAAEGLPHLEAQGFGYELRPGTEGLIKDFTPSPEFHPEAQLYSTTGQATWELDLFGRVRRAVEAAGADRQAMVDARRAVALSALSDLSQDYLQLRALQQRRAVTEENLADAKRRDALVQVRVRDGVAARLDAAQAQEQVATIAEDLPSLREQEARASNAIALLLAEPPRALDAELGKPGRLPDRPPTIPVGLPSDLLRRRPDVQEAEARLHAAVARHGVAVADFYPRVNLLGAFGTQSLSTSNLFQWSSRMFTAGPSVTVPLFEGGQLRGQLELRKAEEREAALSFHQAVLQAWHDVDNALTAYAEAQHRRGEAESALKSDQTALEVADRRYAQGTVDYINIIAAQSAVLRSRDGLVQADAQADADLVALYRALGGGWESPVLGRL